MYEWRIFDDDGLIDLLPLAEQFKEIPYELREDYYYDFQNDNFGLKERTGNAYGDPISKLELKVRLSRENNGAEYWQKVISHEFPFQSGKKLPFYQIEDIIEEEQKENTAFRSYIEAFQSVLHGSYQITTVTKERKKITIAIRSHLVNLEIVKGKIDEKEFQSLTIESENLDIIQELIELWELSDLEPKTGYPGFVAEHNMMTEIETSHVEKIAN